jgi:hypothetical protein
MNSVDICRVALDLGGVLHDLPWVDATVSAFTSAPGDSESRGALTATFADGSTHTIPITITNDTQNLSPQQLVSLVEAKLINAIEAMRLYAKNRCC